MKPERSALSLLLLSIAATAAAGADEFCLDGEFDLGARLQGHHPDVEEFVQTRWCVTSEDGDGRVLFFGSGKSNPDMSGQFEVAYLPPDKVRIVNRASPPDIQFDGADAATESARQRRLDPRRFVEELERRPELIESTGGGWHRIRYPGSEQDVLAQIDGKTLRRVRTTADFPLRGRVAVEWAWGDIDGEQQDFSLSVDGATVFRGAATRRTLSTQESEALWALSDGQSPRSVPGEAWPACVDMQLETLAEGIHLVKGVRTGFHHFVVETSAGLVVGDAPAGWVELQQLPPADLVPGLGVSGLSERLIDFLGQHFPDTSVRAVALTHVHDDHAGGARAFAAAGAAIYAPAEVSEFLQAALNRSEMPDDRLRAAGGSVEVIPVSDRQVLEDPARPVTIVNMGASPHVAASLGMLAGQPGFFYQSDLHVPASDADTPRDDRLATECWFADWAVHHLPVDAIVLNSHRDIRTPLSRLAGYLDSEGCTPSS